MEHLSRALLLFLYLVWLAGWFGVFTGGFDDGFFTYHLDTRLPILFLALLAVAVPPLSAYRAVAGAARRKGGALRAFVHHAVISALPILLFWVVCALWVGIARRAGRIAFEADEAMGYGIDFMICLAAVIAVDLVVGVTLPVMKAAVKPRSPAGRPPTPPPR